MWITLGFEAAVVAVAFGLGWLLGQPPFGQLRAGWWGLGIGVAATVPLAAVGIGSARITRGPPARLLEVVERQFAALFTGCTALDFAVISAAAGVAEEALFRGVLQAGLADRLSPGAGLLIASLLFGLAHLVTPLYAAITVLVGLYLGWIFQASDSLLAAMVTHGLYDFVALRYLARRRRRRGGGGVEAQAGS